LDFRYAGKMNGKIRNFDAENYVREDKSDLAGIVIVMLQMIGSFYKHPALILLSITRKNILAKFKDIMLNVKLNRIFLVQKEKIDLFEAIHLLLLNNMLYKKINHHSVPVLKFYLYFLNFCFEQEQFNEDDVPLQLKFFMSSKMKPMDIQSKYKNLLFETIEDMFTSGNDLLENIGKLIKEIFKKMNIKRN